MNSIKHVQRQAFKLKFENVDSVVHENAGLGSKHVHSGAGAHLNCE